MKGTSKLSIKANKIIGDFKRTETFIDRFTNKYCGKGCARKITIDDFLGMYKSEDERKFIQKYAETNLAFSDTIITISAYIFAIMVLSITLLISVPQLLQNSLVLLKMMLPNSNGNNIVTIVLYAGIISSLIWLIILSYIMPKLSRNEDIIMLIEDKWDDQDESHSNPNTKNKGKDGATMKNGYNIAFIGWIFGALTAMVAMIVTYWMGINYKLSSDDATPILTFILVAITARYAWSTHAIAKQDADRERIAFLERRLEKFYAPMLFFLDFLGGMFLNPENKPAKIEDDPGMQIFTDGKLSTDNRKTCNKKLDEIIQFGYLAKSDVQQSLPAMRSLIIADYYKDNQYQLTIKSLRDKIKRDIDEYTKELKYLVKEE